MNTELSNNTCIGGISWTPWTANWVIIYMRIYVYGGTAESQIGLIESAERIRELW